MSDVAHELDHDMYRLRVVIAGVSPLIWRRLDVPAATTIAGLPTIVQTMFGWSGQHLHQFVVHGTEYGIGYLGGPSFRDDARQVRLADLGLRPGERFGAQPVRHPAAAQPPAPSPNDSTQPAFSCPRVWTTPCTLHLAPLDAQVGMTRS